MSRYHVDSGYKSGTARKHWAPLLPLQCSKCGGVVDTGMAWDVDHIVPLSSGGSANDRNNEWPSHRACNRRAGTAIAQARIAAQKVVDQRFLPL